MKYFLAKSNPKRTIEEHTEDALKLYEQLKTYNKAILTEEEWEVLKIAITYHDLGKINIKFQNKVRKSLGMFLLEDNAKQYDEISHNYLSPAFLDKKKLQIILSKNMLEVLYKSIYYHHSRDKLSRDDEKVMADYINEFLCTTYQEWSWEKTNKVDKLSCSYINLVQFDVDSDDYDEVLRSYYVVKGLLNRIDYCASAGLERIEQLNKDTNGSSLGQKVKLTIENAGFHLRPLQEYMENHKDVNLIIKAATGIGKTEGSLLWIGEEKGFYTLPLKVSINAIYSRIKEKINFKQVSLLHSEALSVLLKVSEEENPHLQYTSSRMLASPLTICTIDQLFKFVFQYNGGEMVLATLSYSKLVIDEIQMYSPELIAIILVGLKKITDLGGKYAIVTATFPHVLYHIMEMLEIPFYKGNKSENTFHNDITTRHRMKLLEEDNFNYNQIVELSKNKRVLVICNTVKSAQGVYMAINSLGGKAMLLHSAYLKKDRAFLENQILEFAPNQENAPKVTGIWVSTQIVEASLDIDFDVLFTEMNSIDSLLQRMGRVYRARLYFSQEPNVYVLDNKSGYKTVIQEEMYDYSLEVVKFFDGCLLEESDLLDMKEQMMDMVFNEKINPMILKSKYYKDILDRIQDLENLTMYELSKDYVDDVFRNIKSITLIPRQIYMQLKDEGKIKEWHDKLNSSKISLEDKQQVKDEVSSYTVSISNYYNLSIDWNMNHLIYHGSRIHLYNGEYDFIYSKGGLGLIKEYVGKEKKLDNIL